MTVSVLPGRRRKGPSERTIHVLTGMVTLSLLSALTIFGVKVANGSLDPVYHLEATFTAAGQGLISDSDVKIHGVNIGRVKHVSLVDGQALVRMEIDHPEKVPVGSTATIRPKTLFGEKFVDIDPGEAEATGPFLEDEDEIVKTVGGFELEKILTDAYPLLQAIDPDELASVLSELAAAGEGSAEATNRQLANFATLSDVQVRHDADTRQFLADLALLSEELARRAPDLVAGARDLNEVLPSVNARGDQLATVLDQAARLSADVADILEANRPFLDKNITQGGKTLQLLYDERAKIAPLVVGLRQFFEVLASVARIPFGDGTNLAAIKFVVGEDSPCGRTVVGCPTGPAAGATAAGAPSGKATPGAAPGGQPPTEGLLPDGTVPTVPPVPGTQAVLDLLGRLAR